MTRPKPSEAEDRARASLFQHLLSIGTPARLLPRKVFDRPDLAFNCAAKTIACECVQFPSAKIIEWLHKRHKELSPDDGKVRVVGTIWPIEVHSWVKEAIEAKQKNIEIYRGAVLADEVWLFVHSHSDDFLDAVYGDQTIKQAMYGGQIASHSFDRIYFFDVRCGVQRIFEPGMPKLAITHDLEPGYPATTTFHYSGAEFTTPSLEADMPAVFEYEVEETHTITVEPIDPAYVARGMPARRISPAAKLRITAYHNRAEHTLIW